MVDTSLYPKRISSYRYLGEPEEGEFLDIELPSGRPPSYAKKVRIGRLLGIIEVKRTRKALLDTPLEHDSSTTAIRQLVESNVMNSDDVTSNADEVRHWARVGYVILFGIIIALFGTTLRFIFSGPIPFALAAFGMLFVIVALWQGSKLEKAQLS